MESLILKALAHAGYTIFFAQLIVSAVASICVMRDREKIQNTLGADYKLTLSPVRSAFIVFFTGGLGLALHWFVTYHPFLLSKLVDKNNSEQGKRTWKTQFEPSSKVNRI